MFGALGIFLTSLLVATSYTSHAGSTSDSLFEVSEQQKQTISGRVTDETGKAMAGVVVQVDGTSQGAITDQNGAYQIKNVSTTSNLLFSFFGYKTVSIPAGQPTINMQMEVDALSMEEVVVVGFGTQKKVNLTGAVAVAGEEVFESRPVTNATSALQGAVPGLNITSGGGGLDETASITIRGQGTIGTGSTGDPLILIDGMEGDINTLNPQDIESVSVLKDAASSSIYGSRAPFGVILITTKKGSADKIKINYNNSFRFITQTNVPDMMSSIQMAYYLNESLTNQGSTVIFEDYKVTAIEDYYYGRSDLYMPVMESTPQYYEVSPNKTYANTDWYDVLWKDWTSAQEHNVTISGGTEKSQVYASFNYLDQKGFIAYGEDKYTRFSTNIRATGVITDFLKYNYNVKFQRVDISEPQALDGTTLYGKSSVWATKPTVDPNGYYTSTLNSLVNGGVTTSRTDKIFQQLQFVATPLKNWNITAEMNVRLQYAKDHTDTQTTYTYDVYGDPIPITTGSTSSVYEAAASTQYTNPNVFSDYSLTLNDAHNFKVMAGFQAEKNLVNSISAQRDGILVPYMTTIDVTSGLDNSNSTIPASVSGSIDEWATVGFFGRFNYDYNGKYLFEANLRYDGTSRYRADQRWNWFPSFSAGWNIAKEEFWGDLSKHISTFKIRGSYGELGNQNTSNLYPTYSEMNLSMSASEVLVYGAQQNTATAPSLISSNMTWETVQTTDIGFDVAALNNRLSVSFDWFNRNTLDMVGPAPDLPEILGTSVPKENNTDMQTRGWEASITWKDRLDNGFNYSVGFNISDYQSTILSYPNENNTLGLGSKWTSAITGVSTTYTSGQKVGEIWGYTTIGIARTDEEMAAHLATLPNGGQSLISGGSVESEWKAGDIMYADINGDGKISTGSMTTDDSGDLSIIGNNTPRYQFGLNLNADYKGFDISAFFQGVMKRDIGIFHPSFFGGGWGTWNNSFITNHLDYFRNDEDSKLGLNLDSYYPRALNSNMKNYQAQTEYLQDASYIRLKNLQIGYSLPQKVLDKIGFSNVRVFASGENLWTGTKLSSIYDPETVDLTDYGINYPLQKTISVGMNVTF